MYIIKKFVVKYVTLHCKKSWIQAILNLNISLPFEFWQFSKFETLSSFTIMNTYMFKFTILLWSNILLLLRPQRLVIARASCILFSAFSLTSPSSILAVLLVSDQSVSTLVESRIYICAPWGPFLGTYSTRQGH